MSAPTDRLKKDPLDSEEIFLQSVVKSFRKNAVSDIEKDLVGKEEDSQVTVDRLLQHYIKEGKPLTELLDLLPKE